MKEIGAAEAASQLASLLDRVEAGEELAITRHGRVIAHLIPPSPAVDSTQGQQASERLRELRRGVTLGGISLRELIDEGRDRRAPEPA
jgi:prevent-host-death family protein